MQCNLSVSAGRHCEVVQDAMCRDVPHINMCPLPIVSTRDLANSFTSRRYPLITRCRTTTTDAWSGATGDIPNHMLRWCV